MVEPDVFAQFRVGLQLLPVISRRFEHPRPPAAIEIRHARLHQSPDAVGAARQCVRSGKRIVFVIHVENLDVEQRRQDRSAVVATDVQNLPVPLRNIGGNRRKLAQQHQLQILQGRIDSDFRPFDPGRSRLPPPRTKIRGRTASVQKETPFRFEFLLHCRIETILQVFQILLQHKLSSPFYVNSQTEKSE